MLIKEVSMRYKEFDIDRFDIDWDTNCRHYVDDGSFVWYDDAIERFNELVAYVGYLEGKLSKYESIV